ncbi:MAG: hypothetical protein AAF756_15620 [Pseudomonadota bacterium]
MNAFADRPTNGCGVVAEVVEDHSAGEGEFVRLLEDGRSRKTFGFGGVKPTQDDVIYPAAKVRSSRKATNSSFRPAVAAGLAAFALAGTAFAANTFFPEETDSFARSIVRKVVERPADKLFESVACADLTGVVSAGKKTVVAYVDQSKCGRDLRTAPWRAHADMLLFVDAVVALEGQFESRSPQSILGINIPGKLKALFSLPFQMAGLTPRFGGSGPLLSFFESVLDERSPGVWKKLGLIRDVAILAAHSSDEELKGYVSRLGVLTGGVGGTLGGQVAADYLFPKPAHEKLQPAEACLLAAGVRRPIFAMHADAGQSHQTRALIRFEQRRRVAAHCLQKLASDGVIQVSQLPEQLQLLSSLKAEVSSKVDGRLPIHWLASELPGASISVREGLNRRRATLPWIHTTLDADAQKANAKRISQYVKRDVKPHLGHGVCIDNCRRGQYPLNVLFAIGEVTEQGLFLRSVYQTHAELLFGPLSGLVHRSAGSVGKLPATVCALRHAPIPSALCRSSAFGIEDANRGLGGSCSDPRFLVSPTVTLGESLNTAFIDWMRRVPAVTLASCLADFGATLHIRPSQPSLAIHTTLGVKVTFSPAHLMRVAAAIAFGKGATPTLLHVEGEDAEPQIVLSDEEVRSMRQLATASINRRINGTLRGVVIPKSCELLAAKSGTSESTKARGVRDALVLLSGSCHGRLFAAIAMVGSASVNIPVGRLNSQDMGSTLMAAVSDTFQGG